VPSILIGHRRADNDASYIDIDNEAAAEAIVDHLIGLGRKRIAHITGRRDSVSSRDRKTGYRRALRRANLPTEGLIIEGDYTAEGGYKAATKLIEAKVDAIFCASDNTAVGALDAIRNAGLRVPDDIALAGFDDLAFASELSPPLTTMRQDIQGIGQEAARNLLTLLDRPEGGPRRVLLPTELVIRQSTVGGLSG
jgi:DNA-binding LacI/PurR family transcriptional regulator